MKQITDSHHTSPFESLWHLETDEAFDIDKVLAAYDKAVATPVWNFFAILPAAADRALLRENGFEIAGSITRDTVTYLKWKKPVRRSGEENGEGN